MTASITRGMCILSLDPVARVGRPRLRPRALRDQASEHGRGFLRLVAAAWLLATLFAIVLAPQPALAQTGPTTLAGKVWRDLDRNGIRENEEVALGVSGITMELWNHDGTELLSSTLTDANGNYALSTFVAGGRSVRVRVVYLSSAFTLAPMHATDNGAIDSDFNASGEFTGFTDLIIVFPGGTTTAIDAGLDPLDIAVGNFTWLDVNANGLQDAGEPGMPDVQVEIWSSDRTVRYDTATSSPSGAYQVSAPGYGSYRLKFSQPAGTTFTSRDVGANDLLDSDVIATGADTGWTTILELARNLISTTSVDAGYQAPQAVDARVEYENVPGIVFPGSTATWTLRVRHAFGATIGTARIGVSAPDGTGTPAWQCTPSGGATCPSMGTGVIDQVLALPAGSALRYDFSAVILPGHHPMISQLASVDVLGGQIDFVPANNEALLSMRNDRLFADGFDP